jgi:phage FluMu protein Com
MPLKVLLAGCSKDEREQAESQVRQALGKRAEASPWTVSLVRIAGQWSVTIDSPGEGVRALTLVAPEGRLREAIVQALTGKPAAAGSAPSRPAAGRAPAAPAGEQRGPSRCTKCNQGFVVIYEAAPDEPEETVAVACPHCWQVNHVLVAEGAAETRDYRAEKA